MAPRNATPALNLLNGVVLMLAGIKLFALQLLLAMLKPASLRAMLTRGADYSHRARPCLRCRRFRRTSGISGAEDRTGGSLIMGEHQRPCTLQHGVERDLVLPRHVLQCKRNVFFNAALFLRRNWRRRRTETTAGRWPMCSGCGVKSLKYSRQKFCARHSLERLSVHAM